MTTSLRSMLFACAIIALAPTTAASEDLYYGGYDGVWRGKLKISMLDLKSGAPQPDPSDLEFELQIRGNVVHVFSGADHEEVKAGGFRIATHKTNAVIYTTDSANDVYDKTGVGGWVETWNFTATHKDTNTLYVSWVRAVNNYLRPPWRDRKGQPFVLSGFGELNRAR